MIRSCRFAMFDIQSGCEAAAAINLNQGFSVAVAYSARHAVEVWSVTIHEPSMFAWLRTAHFATPPARRQAHPLEGAASNPLLYERIQHSWQPIAKACEG